VTPEAKAFLAEAGYDPAFGARPLRRAIQRLIQDPLSLRILEGGFEEGATVRVTHTAGAEELGFEAI
jgi:ATP-dependent Clp protease ATP-binding subunit ClpA